MGLRIGGGVATIRPYVLGGYIDEMHWAMSPVLMGEGEALFAGINLCELGFVVERVVAGEGATYLVIRRR